MTYKRRSESEQFFTATGSQAMRVRTDGTGLASIDIPGVSLREDMDIAELELELRKARGALHGFETEIDRMKSQIAEAQANRHKGKGYADPEWWHRVNAALRHKGRQHQSMQRLAGEINARLRRLRGQAADSRLLSCMEAVATEIVGEFVWRKIYIEAMRRQRELEQEYEK